MSSIVLVIFRPKFCKQVFKLALMSITVRGSRWPLKVLKTCLWRFRIPRINPSISCYFYFYFYFFDYSLQINCVYNICNDNLKFFFSSSFILRLSLSHLICYHSLFRLNKNNCRAYIIMGNMGSIVLIIIRFKSYKLVFKLA